MVHTRFRGRIDNTLTHANGVLRDYKIVVVAESSSPSNTLDFPKTMEYMDCVKAQHTLFTQELGVSEADVMLHFSMGVIPSIRGHIAGGGANGDDLKWISRNIQRFIEE
ncbi:hypothetical protein NX059_010682 [Plenodomus lindquistii]|nr:hypothetical protein NX059_010682 [Plenodomus lindquistii]